MEPGSSTPQHKKKRTTGSIGNADELPADVGQRPVQLQRRRVWRACESCRRKKIKCDGTEPTCSQCQSTGSQCIWVQTKDRAALSRHYVQELEARLLHMESLFGQVKPILDQVGATVPGTSLGPAFDPTHGHVAPLPTISPAAAATAASVLQSLRDKDDAAVVAPPADNRSTPDSSASVKIEDDVLDSLGQLALDEHGHMRWIGGSSTMSLINSFKHATAAPRYRVSPVVEDNTTPNRLYFPAAVFFGKVRALPGPEEVEYPPRDLADKLIDAYFTKFHYLCPVVDKPSFMRQYAYIMDHTLDIHLARKETALIALVFAVFACAAQLVEDPRLKGEREDDGGMGMVYYERALILSYISHASIQVAHVQCFVLMSSFLCSVNCLPQAWILVGQALRHAQDLGMHRSPRKLNIPALEKETRRKIWWGVYTLDRMLALALGRPIGCEDRDCDVELPIAIDDENLAAYYTGAPLQNEQPSLMTGFTSLISLYGIAGRVLRKVYPVSQPGDLVDGERRLQLQNDVDALDLELTRWLDELPAVFKANMVNEKQVTMGAVLCSHYYSVLTALHRNMLPVSREQPLAPRSTAKALSSARACIRLAPFIKNVVAPSHHLAFFIQHLFSCAVIVLLYAMHVTDESAAQAALGEANSCIEAVSSWEGHWPGARKCRELLTELTATAREAVSNQQTDPPNFAPGTGPYARDYAQQPASALPLRERRHSGGSMAGKPIRNKLRLSRNMSPDARSRPLHPSAALRLDANRTRSASRKRGHDETEDLSLHRRQLSQTLGRQSQPTTALSSPTSANGSVFHSPRMTLIDSLPATGTHTPPTLAPPNAQYAMNPSPISPALHSPALQSPANYDLDFGAIGGNAHQFGAGNDNWSAYDPALAAAYRSQPGTPGVDGPTSFDQLFGAHMGSTSNGGSEQGTIDPSQLYGGGANALYGLAPGANFPAPGLPFHGFDYLRNFDGSGGGLNAGADGGEAHAFNAFDTGAFNYDPFIPFSLEGFDYGNGDTNGNAPMQT